MPRYLAIDPGDKRTGLAVGDDVTGHAGPAGVIEAADPAALLRGLRQAIEEHGPDAIVVGVPYHWTAVKGPGLARPWRWPSCSKSILACRCTGWMSG